MTVPVVSILMPVRNEAHFLPAAIVSLQRQTFTDWELVAVDDGSSDCTRTILDSAAENDPRIRVTASPGQGLVPALNHGLSLCRADFVARMDGDDICHPKRLEDQYRFLNDHPDIGLVACNFRHFPRHQLKSGMIGYEEWQNGLLTHEQICRDLFVESPFVHPSTMIRRHVLASVAGYRDLGWAEDYDLWLRLAAAGIRFASLPQTLFFWRDRPERSTRTMQEYTMEAFRRCKVHHLRNGFLRDASEVTLVGAGLEGRAWRKVLDSVGIAVKRWVDLDPRKVGRTLHGAPVVPPAAVKPGSGPMLVTIGVRGARAQVRDWATAIGLVEGVDFLCVT